MAKTVIRGRIRTFRTPEELADERRRLLEEVGMSERKLRARAAQRKLKAHERVVLGDLDDLNWLMA